MATLRGGAKICDSCGADCTRLYGFAMEVRKNMMQDRQVMMEVDKVDEAFGQHDFLFCWSCTAKAFGAKTLEQKEQAEEAKEQADAKLKVKQEQMEKARAAKKPKGQ